MCSLLHGLGIHLSHPPILCCDNLGATYLIANPLFHACTKHMEVDFHFVRDYVVNGKLLVYYLSTKDQLVDIMTKVLMAPRFTFLCDKL